jgi:putative hydrolase of the HAD superfamily
MTIRAVFFDMGGTIETFWHTPEQRLDATPKLRRKLIEAGIEIPLDDQELYKVISSGWERYHKQSIKTMEELPPDRVWQEFILHDHSIDIQKITAAAEELMVSLELNYFKRQMRPEVPAVLETIRKAGYKIGLISNVCSRGQVVQGLRSYGLLEYFDPLVLSSLYGRRKPDPAIFHHAARLANVPTSECLYVGDRIARDIVGARRAGYGHAVQIINEFDHGENDEGAVPDARIQKMTELLDYIHKATSADNKGTRYRKMVRALLFDAGDILYFRPNRGKHLKAFLDQAGVDDRKLPPAEEGYLRKQAYHGQISQSHYREEILRLYGVTDPTLVVRGKEAMDLDDNNIQVIPGVPETLRKLKAEGFLLAIVTDTAVPLHRKLDWFEKGGFGDVWDAVISSKEMGTQKPDRIIFGAALNQLGVTVEETVFVGHSPDELDGARAMGMKAVAFNYDEQARADYYIKEFKDLLDVPILRVEEDHVEVIVK